MRFLSLIGLSILLMAGCQDDEELVPAPCEDPSYRYRLDYSFRSGGNEISPKWIFYTNETAIPRGVNAPLNGSRSARILEDACEETNDVTAISSHFNNTTGEYGWISINAYQYFNYEGYPAIQPYLFDIQPDELLNFRSCYVKISTKP